MKIGSFKVIQLINKYCYKNSSSFSLILFPFKVTIRIMLISFFIIGIRAQQKEKGNANIENTGLYLNNLSIDWIRMEKNLQFSGNLKTFQFGFKNVNLLSNQLNSEQKYNLKFHGPEISLSGLKIKVNTYSPNWINKYIQDYQQKRQEPAIIGISILDAAIDSFSNIQKFTPRSFDELVMKNYIKLDQFPFNQKTWNFKIKNSHNIIATLPSNRSIRSDQKIIYDRNADEYYGDYQPIIPIDSIDWEITLLVKEVNQTFSTEATLSYTKEKTNFEFYQKKGKFNIIGINLEAIPKTNIIDLAKFNLSQIGLETRELAFSADLSDSIPILHQGGGRFILRNLNVNIPTSLSEEPEIGIYLEKLGIWNGAFLIRLIDLDIKIISERMGEIKFRFQTPYINFNLDGDISIHQKNGNTLLHFQQTVLRINPISLGVRTFIHEWEKKNNLTMPRKSGAIILKMNGPINKPRIDGLTY